MRRTPGAAMNTLVGPLPAHQYVYVDPTFVGLSGPFLPAVWFGLVSYPGRAWGCTVLLESGAVYRNLPPHALAFDRVAEPWGLEQAQTWDCYGFGWTALVYPYLDGLSARVRCGGGECEGDYLFTVAPVGDAYSAAPEQAKEFTFLRTHGARLTIQPTNQVLFREASFPTPDAEWPKGLHRQTAIYQVEP